MTQQTEVLNGNTGGLNVVSQSGLERFVDLVDAYFDAGGSQIQFNVVDNELLLDAQEHPEEYSGLIVRVAGYSAFFTQLSKDVQQDIIERTAERL